jgi:predicted ATPase/5-methylcytosine-specific restriction endonuclease McrA
MIRIRRPYVSPIPAEITEEARAALELFYTADFTERQQRRAPLDRLWNVARRSIKPALLELFYGKCAYCESPLGVASEMEIDQFRPVSASDVDGRGSLEHYQWLRLEWENLYPACAACNRAKRGLFPVDGPRAPVRTPIERIPFAERALLIDPCRDNPEDHLQFLSEGIVHGRTPMGVMTIKILNLNREGLISARARVMREITAAGRAGYYDASLMQPIMPYSAAAAAAFRTFGDSAETVESQRKDMIEIAEVERRTPDEILAADAETYRLTQRPLRSVHIRNFKMLRDASIGFPEPTNERAPCLVLIGENASGKSTILQAIALALAGADEATKRVDARRVLTRGASEGEIVLEFWDNDAKVGLAYRRGDRAFFGTSRPSATVRAFGALRHMERRNRRREAETDRHARIQELIRPISRIEFPDRWLLGLDTERFNAAARALIGLLPVQAGTVLTRTTRSVQFSLGSDTTRLNRASAGYQTVVGMAVEIMKLVFEFWETLESASAVVLIDELDAHLHPRWKMRIMQALRDAFPNIQFIGSTHDPLVLRGLRNHEIALVKRDPKLGAIIDTDLPAIEGMQVDEILTSKVFGLDTTVDPDTEALLDEYYYISSLDPTQERLSRLAEIRERYGDKEALGRNARENAMLAAGTLFLRDTADLPPVRAEDLKESTVRRLREIFADVAASVLDRDQNQ